MRLGGLFKPPASISDRAVRPKPRGKRSPGALWKWPSSASAIVFACAMTPSITWLNQMSGGEVLGAPACSLVLEFAPGSAPRAQACVPTGGRLKAEPFFDVGREVDGGVEQTAGHYRDHHAEQA